jgi:hypothetical protein
MKKLIPKLPKDTVVFINDLLSKRLGIITKITQQLGGIANNYGVLGKIEDYYIGVAINGYFGTRGTTIEDFISNNPMYKYSFFDDHCVERDIQIEPSPCSTIVVMDNKRVIIGVAVHRDNRWCIHMDNDQLYTYKTFTDLVNQYSDCSFYEIE